MFQSTIKVTYKKTFYIYYYRIIGQKLFVFFIDSGRSSVNVTKFLQGFVDNEVILNPEGTCTLTCADYKKTYIANCQQGSICATNQVRKCNGVLRNCHGLSDSVDICPSVRYNKTQQFDYYFLIMSINKQFILNLISTFLVVR